MAADPYAAIAHDPYASIAAPAPVSHVMSHVTTPFVDPKNKPAFDTSKSDAAIENQGVDAANTVGGTLGLFNRLLKASKALLNEGVTPGHIDLGAGLAGAGRALAGTPNPGEEAGNDAKNAAAISTIFKKLGVPDNALTHGLYETGQDPANLLSVPISKGRTAMGVLTDAAEGHGFNAAVKAGNALSKVAPKVTDAIAKAHDLLGVHSAAKRELATLHGAQWIDKYAEYRARLMQMGGKPDPALDAQAIKEAQAARTVQAPAAATSRPAETANLFRYQRTPGDPEVSPVTTGTFFSTDPNAALRYRRPGNDISGLGGPNRVERVAAPSAALDVAQSGNAAKFKALGRSYARFSQNVSDADRGGVNAERYLLAAGLSKADLATIKASRDPMATADAFTAALARKKGYDAIRTPDEFFALKPGATRAPTSAIRSSGKPHFTAAEVARLNKNRVPPAVHGPATTNTNAFAIPPSKPGRIRTWANAGVPPEKAAPAFSPEDQKIFGLMTDPEHGGGGGKNGLMDLASMPSDLITGGMFAQPVGHMANISGLGAMTDLSAVGSALGRGTVDNAKKLGALPNRITGGRIPVVGPGPETDASIAARHAPAQRGGAISTHKTERDNPLDSSLSGASSLASKVPVVGKALAAVPGALRGLYRASGDILWKFDDEVKANRFQNLVDSGMDPSRAGLRVGGELVDYENKSPAARALRPVAPFSTWRTKAPLAVARNAIENPGRVAALNRAAPAAMGGSQGNDPQTGKPYISSLPAAEFNKATSSGKGAANYALGGLGVVPRLGLDAVGQLEAMQLPGGHNLRTGMAADAKKKQLRTQGTYGQEPGTFLLNELPISSQALQYGPGGMFNKGQAPTTLSDLLSLLRVRPGTP